MEERTSNRPDGWSWAIFFARWVLGLIFFMAGWWKTFDLGPLGHARRLFIEPYADSWIPMWLLWASGTVIPIIERPTRGAGERQLGSGRPLRAGGHGRTGSNRPRRVTCGQASATRVPPPAPVW